MAFPVKRLASLLSETPEDSIMSDVLPSIIVLARTRSSAGFSPRTHHPSGQEMRPARSRRKTQHNARTFIGGIAKAQRHGFTGQK